MLTRDEVKRLAELALIDISDDELAPLAREMDAILGYVGELSAVSSATKDAAALPELRNVLRDDTDPRPGGEYTEALLSAAPHREGDYVRVKKVL